MSPSRKNDGATAPTGDAQTSGGAQRSGDTADAVSYEHARDELADVVQRLEAGGLNLDESLTLWERGEALARICQRFLDGARQRVQSALDAADVTADRTGDGTVDGTVDRRIDSPAVDAVSDSR